MTENAFIIEGFIVHGPELVTVNVAILPEKKLVHDIGF